MSWFSCLLCAKLHVSDDYESFGEVEDQYDLDRNITHTGKILSMKKYFCYLIFLLFEESVHHLHNTNNRYCYIVVVVFCDNHSAN